MSQGPQSYFKTTINLPVGDHRKLRILAAQTGLTYTDILRMLVDGLTKGEPVAVLRNRDNDELHILPAEYASRDVWEIVKF